MLAKSFRLNLRTDKSRILASGRTYYSSLFTLIVAPQSANASPNSRFAIITSRKFHPLSVKRHQIKREIYQIIREFLPKLTSPHDFLIIPKHTLLTASPDHIRTEFTRLIFQ